ncbi:MAG: type II secretion system protein [Phycisphaerales bacterium]
MVSIIALLIAILLPSLNKARDSARRIQCASNLKQLFLGVDMYAMDWNGDYPAYRYPPEGIWNGNSALGPLLNLPYYYGYRWPNARLCPKAINAINKDNPGKGWGLASLSYGMNGTGLMAINAPTYTPVPGEHYRFTKSKISRPADAMQFIDSLDFGVRTWGSDNIELYMSSNDTMNGSTGGGNLSYRHELGSNLAFFDGHVGLYSHTQIEVLPYADPNAPNAGLWKVVQDWTFP